MHIPPYHKKKTWQRFFAGSLVGGIIAYIIFIFMHGTMYENQLKENLELTSQVNDLKNQNEALLKDTENLKTPVTVSAIDITIENAEEISLDSLIVPKLEELVKDEISHITGQSVSIVDEIDQLLISAIENKEYTIDDIHYQFTVRKLTISETVKVFLEAETVN
ncbi:sporulation membrane protein YtrI [Oceanobacillus picturae]|uniref:Sporulation membrane protein YtrI n=1 Tax=Oceanobacillus picturae TaxID=171693 RepID=A0A0U9H9U9_9BACI|nr:sporulation membrane protein YtrI [Oceanobacillus picturae]GAQ19443.1 sporulation membrane protein YtrI [Oceanobacillus picturae]